MLIKNTEQQYGIVSKTIHWLIVLLVALQFYLIFWREYVLPKKSAIANFYLSGLHKPIGASLLLIVLFAIFWKLMNQHPIFPKTMRAWEILSANVVHYALYIVLIIMSLSGFLMSDAAGYPLNYFGLYQFPQLLNTNKELSNIFFNIHSIAAFTLILLIGIHTLAALKHHFINKDNILKRMWF